MATALELEHVTKLYGNVTALDDISLTVPAQRVVGLIGRNGSGKTTLLHHLVGLLLPTSGSCVTLEKNAAALGADELSRIGVVYQENRFLEWMTVSQHLQYVSSFYTSWDTDRQDRLLAELELKTDVRIATLSPGDVQKMGLILAVCHHPELLLLDEPVSALDPIARQRLLEFLLDLLHEDALHDCHLLTHPARHRTDRRLDCVPRRRKNHRQRRSGRIAGALRGVGCHLPQWRLASPF